MLHTGGRQVRPGVLLVAPSVRVLPLRSDSQRRRLPLTSATSGTTDLPNLSGCFGVSGAFVNKGRQIQAEPISDWRSLSNVPSSPPPSPPTKGEEKCLSLDASSPGMLERATHAESPAATDQSGIDLQDGGPSLALQPFLGKLCCHCIR